MSPALQNLFTQLKSSSPAGSAELQATESETGLKIPAEYRQILAKHDGGEIHIGSTELLLWSTSYIRQAHSEFEVESALPGALLFASDQNEDAYAFDLRPGKSGSIMKVPMIGMSWAGSTSAGTSFKNLLENLT